MLGKYTSISSETSLDSLADAFSGLKFGAGDVVGLDLEAEVDMDGFRPLGISLTETSAMSAGSSKVKAPVSPASNTSSTSSSVGSIVNAVPSLDPVEFSENFEDRREELAAPKAMAAKARAGMKVLIGADRLTEILFEPKAKKPISSGYVKGSVGEKRGRDRTAITFGSANLISTSPVKVARQLEEQVGRYKPSNDQ